MESSRNHLHPRRPHSRSIATFGKGRRVNPFNTAHHSVVQAFLWSGDHGRAAAELEVWKSASPESKYVCWYLPQPALLMGDFNLAERQLRESLERFPGEPLLVTMEGLLQAFRGNSGAALDCAQRACRFPDSFGHTHHTYYQLAGIHAVLGDTAQAMQWLERSVESGYSLLDVLSTRSQPYQSSSPARISRPHQWPRERILLSPHSSSVVIVPSF